MKDLNTPNSNNQETSHNREASVVLALASLGKDLSRARAHSGKTLDEVSRACGLSTVWISRLEKGKLDNASIKSLAQLAGVYNLKLSFHV